MKIKVENLGFISSGEIQIKDLTIIFGKNNVGKTYLSYATYGILNKLLRMYSESNVITIENLNTLRTNGTISIDSGIVISKNIVKIISEEFTNDLPSFFNTKETSFTDSKVEIDPNITDKELINLEFASEIELDNNGIYSINKKKGNKDVILSFIKIPDEAITNPSLPGMDDLSTHRILSSLVSRMVLQSLFQPLSNPFVITSERTGISLFYKEMDSHRSSLFNNMMFSDSRTLRSMNKRIATYSTPISDNINIIRQYEGLTKRKSFIYSNKTKNNRNLVNESLESMLSGSFKHANGETIYTKKDIDENNKKNISIPISISSSSIKSLFLLDLYVKHIAQKGDFLVIDEPELNLHPENQIKMAELIVRLVNSGVKIIMTTHSDYIIKEINNRIMLNSIKDKKNLHDLDFSEADVINKNKVSAFTICDNGEIKEISVDKYGINQEIFDDVILSLNERSDLIFEALSLES